MVPASRYFTVLYLTCAMLLLGASRSAAATAPPGRLLADYTHTAWNGLQGAPSDVMKFAQTSDGWLWMATPTGLFRFDGVSFERMDAVQGHRLQSGNTLGLLAGADGSLWVGYRFGGISMFRNGQTQLYTEAQGLPSGAVMSISEAPDGTVWAATQGGLAWLAPGARNFRLVGADSGLPPAPARQVLFARDGAQWVSVRGGVYVRAPGQRHYLRAWPHLDLMAMAESADGTLWASDGVSKQYRLARRAPADARPPRPELPGNGMHFDRDGVMWILKAHALERRFPPWRGDGDASQQLNRENGISGPLPQTFFQDREGNLWIGTSAGLDRLRRNRLRLLAIDEPFDHPAMVAAEAGRVLVGDYAGALRSFDAGGPLKTELNDTVSAACRASDGTIWLANSRRLLRRDHAGIWHTTALPAGLSGTDVQALAADRHGRLWLSVVRRGLYRHADGKWLKDGGLPGLPDDFAMSMSSDAAGRLWLGYRHNQIAVVDGQRVALLGTGQGLQLGNVLALFADGERLWVGGEHGAAWFDGHRFVTISGGSGQAFRGVSGIVRTDSGELWLHGADGISRIAAHDVARMLAAPARPVPFERFNALDGLQGSASQLRPLPSLLQAADRKLWFATASEIATIDPRHILRNGQTPPVQIRAVRSGGRSYAPSAELLLPEGSADLQIGFTALSLSMPERVRFRYRLQGVDDDWQEPVGRRDAFYTRLAPGAYQFTVTAANEDGLWNQTGATLQVTIPPRFVQTQWFVAVLIAFGVLALYALYLLRVRQVTARMLALQHERLTERERIARGLHDTLLQSIQGLIMFFDHQVQHLPQQSEERLKIEQTLELADRLLLEGRDHIMDLRSAADDQELGQTLRQYGTVLLHESYSVTVRGQPRQLHATVRDEIHAIAREALLNAARHARATDVALSLNYAGDKFTLQVKDNGRGLEPAVLLAGARAGHWGLPGMRERAQAIGAQYSVQTAPGGGTSVQLSLPARLAYVEQRRAGMFARLRRRYFGSRKASPGNL